MLNTLRGIGLAAITCWLIVIAAPDVRADFGLNFDTAASGFTSAGGIGFGEVDATLSPDHQTVTFSNPLPGTGTDPELVLSYTPNYYSDSSVSDGGRVLLGTFSLQLIDGVTHSRFFGDFTSQFSGLIFVDFTLSINQTVPEAGVGTQGASMGGVFGFDKGIFGINFNFSGSTPWINVPTMAPNVIYTLQTNDLKTLLLTDHATIPLTATVLDPPIPTPEPSTLALAGTGSLALLGHGWRRRRRRSARRRGVELAG